MISRRDGLKALVAGGVAAIAGNASAQAFPSRTITMLVGFSAGGPADTTAWFLERLLASPNRTMKLLHECGLAHARNFGDGQTRYEAAVGRHHHDHLICTRCGTIVEFENDRIEALQDKVARQHGFQVTSHKMELYGFCESCQRAIAGGDSPRA